jgi:hypothetical protein
MSKKAALAFLAGGVVTAAASYGNCLCVYDVDRTLTGAQGNTEDCPNNEIFAGIPDPAYGNATGVLTLSEHGQDGGASGYCGGCYMGVVSAGDAGGTGSAEREQLLIQLNASQRLDGEFLDNCPSPVTSPLVLSCTDGFKQRAVANIVAWYGLQGIDIADGDVYFFDDVLSNVAPFVTTGFNARQISCAKRDGNHGLCGATLAEVTNTPGVLVCGQTA